MLLEIETDKAQMDVEAQEDGVLAKILVPGGTHSVKVGKPIAILAEEGDDISIVEIPEENTENLSPTSPSKVEQSNQTKEELSLQTSPKSDTSSSFYTLYSPSVFRLLQEYNIEDPKLIPPTGPQGRLLKGDVLAYVGNIDRAIPKQLKEVLAKKQKLDLSIITAQKAQRPLQLEVQTPVTSPLEPAIPAQVATTVRLTRLLKLYGNLSGLLTFLCETCSPLEAFSPQMPISSLIEKASNRALADVPRFGLRKLPAADLYFAELIDECPQTPSMSPSSPPFLHCASEEELTPSHHSLEKVYGSMRYLSFELS